MFAGVNSSMKKWKSMFMYCLAIELVEEMLEELIAWGISNFITWAVTKALSAIIVVSLTQATKIVIKKIIKRITYKEGNDKVNKLKTFFKWIWANKCTLGGVATGALFVVSGVGAIDVNSLPELNVKGLNLTPFIYYGVLGVLAILCSFFPESVEKFAKRIAEHKAEKEAKAIQKEAKAELKSEEKLANQTQAQAEKAQAKAEAKAKAEAEKQKAEAEHRAKIDAEKAKLIAQNNQKA